MFWMRFEATRERADKPIFEVIQGGIGGGLYVRATRTDGTADRIEGFATEGDTGRWISNESAVWLDGRKRA